MKDSAGYGSINAVLNVAHFCPESLTKDTLAFGIPKESCSLDVQLMTAGGLQPPVKATRIIFPRS